MNLYTFYITLPIYLYPGNNSLYFIDQNKDDKVCIRGKNLELYSLGI